MTLLNLRHLVPSIREHRAVEDRVLQLLREALEEAYLKPLEASSNPFRYAQRNIFSILFLAIYRALEIPAERRLIYGVVNHAIRGIVTGTDNLLDDEYKEMLPLNFPAPATRFKSVMHILLFDRFLFRVLDDAVAGKLLPAAQKQLVQQKIFRALVPIGEEEAGEEGGVHEILKPSEIIDQVHRYKGGNLLRLAFVAPRLMESERLPELETADAGIYRIGLALQVIDDLTDFYPDIRDRKHNYLVSSIYAEGSPEERLKLEALLGQRPDSGAPVEEIFRDSVSRVMHRAIGEALAGFEGLESVGFWFTRQDALKLIRYLFRLRGVAPLLALWPAGNRFEQDLGGAYGP